MVVWVGGKEGEREEENGMVCLPVVAKGIARWWQPLTRL